jgi:hypothetical protein
MFVRQMCLRQAIDNGLLEQRELIVIFRTQAPLFNKFPEPFNQVQVRRIRRKKRQFNFQRMMVAFVIERFFFFFGEFDVNHSLPLGVNDWQRFSPYCG